MISAHPDTHKDAEHVLAGSPYGTYIVRKSASAPGDYVLSISIAGGVDHLQVGLLDPKFYQINRLQNPRS